MQDKQLRLTNIFIGLVAMSFTPSIFADCLWSCSNNCMSAPCGWYVELNGGATHISNISYPNNANTTGVGVNLNAGYKFMPYFAMELGYTQYANTTIKDELGNKLATINHYSYDLAAKGILPMMATGFEFFAKLGVERNNAKLNINNDAVTASAINLSGSSHSDTSLYLGIGGQYYLSPEFAVVVQWQRADGNGNVGVLDLYSIGVSVLFS